MRRGNGGIKVISKVSRLMGLPELMLPNGASWGVGEHKNMPQCCQHAAVAVASQSICLWHVASCALLPFDSCKINLCENAQLTNAAHVETLHKAGQTEKAKEIEKEYQRERESEGGTQTEKRRGGGKSKE